MVHSLAVRILEGATISSIILLVIFLIFYKFVFLRDPPRQIPPGKTVVSPADGDVAAIIDITGERSVEIPKGRWGKIKTMASDVKDAKYLVLIVMNVWHVHVNRAPIEGKIVKMKHVPGKFVNAVKNAESFPTIENEKLEIVYDSPELMAKTVQIAGVLARRIQPFVKEGDKVLKGQRIGRILLGSQVALILPEKVRLKVKVGDAVKAGSSIIGEWE